MGTNKSAAAETQAKLRQEFRQAVNLCLSSNKALGRYFAASAVVMLFMGILVWCAVFGLWFALVLLALIYAPAYRLLRNLIQVEGMPVQFVEPRLAEIFYVCFSLIFPVFFLAVGMVGLPKVGFCAQNIACGIAVAVRRFLLP